MTYLKNGLLCNCKKEWGRFLWIEMEWFLGYDAKLKKVRVYIECNIFYIKKGI